MIYVTSAKQKLKLQFFKCCLCLLFLIVANQSMATAYIFPSKMPSGCAVNGGGIYSCGAVSLSYGDTVDISGAKPATINFSGNFDTYNAQINTSGAASDLTIIVNGILTIGYGTNINANISASTIDDNSQGTIGGSITTTTGAINIGYATDVTGLITSTTGAISLSGSNVVKGISCNCSLSVGYQTTINGDVTAASVSDTSSSVIYNGSITTTSGDIKLGYATSVSGSVTSAGNVNMGGSGNVQGCVQSKISSGITLNYSDTAAAVCCGSSSCTNGCVTNNSSKSMPPICTVSTPTPIAYYHLDESAWTGLNGEVKDSSGNNYNGTINKSTSTERPNTESGYPFIAGNPGTCNYSIFGGSGNKYNQITLPTNFPNLTGSLTISAWLMTFENYNVYRIFTDDANNSGGYGLSLADAGTGTVRFFKRLNSTTYMKVDTPSIIQNNVYYFITVSVDSVNQNATIYIYNTSGTLVNKTTGPMSYFSATDSGQASIATVYNGTGLHGRMDEVSIYNSALTQSQIQTLVTQKHTCPTYNVLPTNFNCVAVGAASNTGHLYTQLTDNAFNIDIVALKTDGTTETNYVNSGTKDITLEFVDGSGSTSCGSRAALSPAISQTVTFAASDAGRKTVSNINITKAYRDIRCRVTDAKQSPSIVGCSSDDFAVRPSSFMVTATGSADADSTGTSTTASPKIKTGANFSLTATANAIGYDGTPSVDTTKLSAHSGAAQAGIVSGNFAAANPTTSAATGSTFNYNEVGYFRFNANGVYDNTFAAVDSANGDCNAGFSASGSLNACSFGNAATTNYFGRFYPDHFALTPNTATPACSNNFTYFGQDGLITNFTLKAQNTANITTQNYTGSFAKLGLTTWTNYNFLAATLPAGASLFASATAPSGTWSNGSASVSAKHLITRPSAATAPANITISAAATDSDGVTMASTAVSAASSFQYGRLFMPNTYGSELFSLNVPIEAQYWNGSAYQRNRQDSCSVIPAASIAMGNYKNNLDACETALSGAGAMSAGKVSATLSKPGSGNNGSVDLTINLSSAAGKYCTAPSPPPPSTSVNATAAGLPWFGITNPSSRAVFGLFKTPVIYMRENFGPP